MTTHDLATEAADWVSKLSEGSDQLTRDAFAAWVAQSPQHLREYLAVSALLATLEVRWTSDPNDDPRFTMGLYLEVIAVLEKHGFVRAPDPAAHAGSLVELLHMVREFEGRASP